jgi:hypothetical protein
MGFFDGQIAYRRTKILVVLTAQSVCNLKPAQHAKRDFLGSLQADDE